MWWRKVLGAVLIAAGVVALVYGEISYTKETHEAKVAGLEFSLEEKETFEIPTWAGVASVAAGTLLLLIGRRR
jgi:drug/metabolite transporter (DMT)-like permease